MYKEILHTIQNVQIWPEISLVIFFTFFMIVLIRVVRTDKGFIEKMKNQPLNDSTISENKKME